MKRKRAKKDVPVAPVSGSAVSGWLHVAALLGLLLANFLLYYRVLDLGFLSLDDPDYVENNPYIQSFNAENLRRIFGAPYFANYAPAHLLSYSVDVALAGGKSAIALHLSSVLWHGWVVCMVYLLTFTIRRDVLLAVGAAMLFLAHPAHVEVVAWISSRKDLLATGFAALAMTCYLLYRRQPPHRGRWWYAGSLLSFLLASASKQSVVLLPAVMLVWDLLVERRQGATLVLDKIPFSLIALLFAWMTYGAQPATRRAHDILVLATTELRNLWLLTGFGDYVLYHSNVVPGAWSRVARFLVVVVAGFAWAAPFWWARRGQPVPAALGYWVLISLIPPMALSFTTPVTDRYLFLASVGFCLLLAEGVRLLTGKWPAHRRLILALLPCVAVVWGVRTWTYLSEWHDPRSVWFAAASKSTAMHVAQYLGQAYQDAGVRIDEHVKRGTALDVSKEVALARLVVDRPERIRQLVAEWQGTAADKTQSQVYRDRLWEMAWQQYELATARRGTLSAPNLYLRRGKLLVDRGEAQRAIPELKLALEFARGSSFRQTREESVAHILRGIGIAYWNLRDYAEAARWYLEAQKVQNQSGRRWLPELDQEVERIQRLASGQPPGKPGPQR